VSSLLHEVYKPEKLLKAVRDWCAEDTIIHFNTPNSNSFHRLWGRECGMIHDLKTPSEKMKLMQRNRVFYLDELVNLLEAAGYECMEKGSYFLKLFNDSKMLRAVNDGLIDNRLLDGLYTLTDYFPENGSEIYVNCKYRL